MSSNSSHIFDKDWPSKFEWYEYSVFTALLVVSMGIGIFYGFFDKKNKTREEYLLGGRSMSIFPVALSTIFSFVSATSLLGGSLETYFYGFQYITNAIGFVILAIVLSYVYVPVYFTLNLTSIYEYLEMRFDRRVRVVVSLSHVIYSIIFMTVTVYAPALALEEVAGINKWVTCVIIFVICIAYSSLGGLKAVVWTDAIQALVLIASMVSVIIVGADAVGGMGVVWERSEKSGRLQIWNFDFDPRTRHTFWTGIFAGYFNRVSSFAATQSYMQRYLAVSTLTKARQVISMTAVGFILILLLTSLTGLVMYANYIGCDPVEIKAISSSDQLLPLFVMDKLGDIPLLPGLFVAALTAGSLSTVSTMLNSVAAVVTVDYVKKFRPALNEIQLAHVSKVSACIIGLVSFSLIVVVEKAGNVLPFAVLLIGLFVGPGFGAFTLGMLFPWSNALGVLLGFIPSVAFTLFIGVGSIIAGNKKQLPVQKLPLSIAECYESFNSTTDYGAASFAEDLIFSDARAQNDWKDKEYSVLIKLLSISYTWHQFIPIVTSICCGLLFSFVVSAVKQERERLSDEKLFSVPILKLWKKICGKNHLMKYVNFNNNDNTSITNKPFLSIVQGSNEGKCDTVL